MIRTYGPFWGFRELGFILPPRDTRERLLTAINSWYGTPGIGFLAVGRGRGALYLALQALGVRNGAKVAIGAMCCQGATMPIFAMGAEPVYVDTEPGTFCMDTGRLKDTLASNDISAVVAAHFVGQRNDMCSIQRVCRDFDVPLVDDAAYLPGFPVGDSIAGMQGDFGLWSFNSKLLVGVLGAILIGPHDELERIRRDTRTFAYSDLTWGGATLRYCKNLFNRFILPYLPHFLTKNLDTLKNWWEVERLHMSESDAWGATRRQCFVMLTQLGRFHEICKRALRTCDYYRERLGNHPAYQVSPLPHGGFYGVMVPVSWRAEEFGVSDDEATRADKTFEIQSYLFERGIRTKFYVPVWWSARSCHPVDYPSCRDMWPRTVYLPNTALTRRKDVERICDVLDEMPQALYG